MALSYTIREGLAGFRRAKFAVVASTSAMTVALVLIGLFVVLGYETQQVSTWLRQRVGEVELFLEDADDRVLEALYERAAAMPGVEQTEYISREQAEAIFQQEFGEGAAVFLDEPFLPASIKVRVTSDYANADSLNALVTEFSTWNRVDEVVFNQPLLVKVQQNLRLFTLGGLAVGLLVVLSSIFLVANTIRLTIYARRLLIRTMKLVGATDGFIRRPFLVEGILQGFIAGGIAAALVWGLHNVLRTYLPQVSTPDTPLLVVLTLTALVGGVVLGWLGSLYAAHRFIKKVALH